MKPVQSQPVSDLRGTKAVGAARGSTAIVLAVFAGVALLIVITAEVAYRVVSEPYNTPAAIAVAAVAGLSGIRRLTRLAALRPQR